MIPHPYRLRLSATIRNEWHVRCIGDVIPALEGACWDVPRPTFDAETVRAIAEDCRFMVDPNGPSLYPNERAVCRALLRQCETLGF